jgi:ABC-type transport system substrate-binding protein
MLTEYIPNARMELVRNPNYRGVPYPCEGEPGDKEKGFLKDCGQKTPFVDKVVSVIEKEATSVATKFIQGYYDIPQLERGEPGIGYQVSIQDGTGRAKELLERKIQLPSTIQVGFWHFGFNWLDPVVGLGKTPEDRIRNKKLRQALAIAFDFEEYVSIFEDNRAQVNHSVVVPGLFGNNLSQPNPVIYDKLPDGKFKRKSIEGAKKLLAEAGYPNGRDIKTGQPLTLNYDTQGVGPGYKARLDWVAKQFAKLNIQIEIRNTDYNRFQDKMRKGSAQFFFWGWLADYPDPENFLFLLYGPNSKAKFDGENSSNYANAEFDQLFDRMKDLEDTPERAAMIGKMIEIMQDELPMLYGWSEEFGGAYHQWVFNGKPSNIIRDALPYLRLDTQLRTSKIREWNQAIWWPLVVLPLLLLGVAWPAWNAWCRRQSQRAVQGSAQSQGGL